jgi:hypothetical protein
MARKKSSHVSSNRLSGSLCDEPLGELLESCKRNLITGTIRIEHGPMSGAVELRAGCIDDATYGALTGDNAIVAMRSLRDGMYELGQRLPRLTGALGDSANCEGELGDVKLVELMRHCEDQALSCTITIISDFERGEIVYKCGDIERVVYNGVDNDDAIVDIVRFERGRFRVAAPPLALDIGGWPSVTRDPTEPFRLDHLQHAPPPRRPAPAKASPPPLPGLADIPDKPTKLPNTLDIRVAARRPARATSVAPLPVAAPLDAGMAARASTHGGAIGGRDFAMAGIVALTVMSFAALLWVLASRL